jgi:hypothetical protein
MLRLCTAGLLGTVLPEAEVLALGPGPPGAFTRDMKIVWRICMGAQGT